VSDTEVMQTIKEIKAKYNLNDEEFAKAIAKEGFTLKDYKEKLSEQIIASKLVEIEVKGKVVVTEKEVNDYILRNKDAADEGYVISLILVKDGDNKAAAEEKSRAAHEKIKGGASFADIAKEYSDDSSARYGGEKGFVRKVDLSKEYLDVIAGLKKGEVSAPFRTPTGMTIVKLEDSRIFTKDGDLKTAVKAKLMNSKSENAYKAWIKGLRQKAYVEIR